MTTATRAVRVGDRSLPVVLPNPRDARLHTAAVIVSIHVIGITALGFRVSVPQIAVAIVTAGLIDVAVTFRSTGMLVWPASGMLTGSGVALILRLTVMESGDYWSWTGWYWFALVAAVSISTKYVVRHRGTHVFNPSNIGLVLAFLVIGSHIVEPLDFWWAPLGPWMALAYGLILGGGVLITRRLRLLEMAVVFWIVLAGGLGAVAASGHCMTAAWSPTPVCGERFWSVLVTSPEILIFLFFMITDPKTIPVSRQARVVFAATLGLITTLMIAPHTVEYGAKVGLLASLALWSPLRGVFQRIFPSTNQEVSGIGDLLGRLGRRSTMRVFVDGIVAGAIVVLAVVAIVAAGSPARHSPSASTPTVDVPVEVDAAGLPDVVVDDSVRALDLIVDEEFAEGLAVTLAENLAIEAEAIRSADGSLLALSTGGGRLDEVQARLDTAIATGERWVDEYSFENLTLGLHEAPEGQSSAGLVFETSGTLDRVLYDAMGFEQERHSERFQTDFVMRLLAGQRWVVVDGGPST